MTYTQLTFSDSLDPNVWTAYGGPGNAGIGTYSSSAITVNNGICTLSGNKSTSVTGGMKHNLTGKIYGQWDIRAKCDAGNGWWPCIGLWPDTSDPFGDEIDIVEMPEGARTETHHTLHYGPDNTQSSHVVPNDGTVWHTYGVNWEPTALSFLIDDTPTFTITDPLVIPQVPMHLFIQLNEGPVAGWAPAPDSTTTDIVSLYIDWVRYE